LNSALNLQSNADERWHWQFAEHYEILHLLAKGGQGTIYAARDSRSGQRVALKIIENEGLESSEAHQRLMVEAGIGNCLNCEHVVTVYDAGRDPVTDLSYLTMELLEGTDLQRFVEKNGPVEVSTAVEYLRQIATGLDIAHTWRDSLDRLTPIVHRDLKPANLFIANRSNDTPQIKILDFGIAKLLEESVRLTPNMRGSPLYMAPEQVLGAQVSPATDIWAIGLLAFFLLTGKAYWLTGQKRRSILPSLFREIARGATALPSRRLVELGVQRDLPPPFDNWFLRCVHREPKKRFESAGAAVAALAQALGTNSTSKPPKDRHSQVNHRGTPAIGLEIPRRVNLWQRCFWFWFSAFCGFSTVIIAAKPSVDRMFPSCITYSGPQNNDAIIANTGNWARAKVSVSTNMQCVRPQREAKLNLSDVRHLVSRPNARMLPRTEGDRMNFQVRKIMRGSDSANCESSRVIFGAPSFNEDFRDSLSSVVDEARNSTGSTSYGG
jgi:serine/threonine-protein kinase